MEQEILRVLRQVCVLVERGQKEEASRLQTTQLDPLIAAHRRARGDEVLPDDRLLELYAAEQKRVAEASVLSALLAPMLAEKLQHPAGWRHEAGAARAAVFTRAEASARRLVGIADFIDEMIAQDHAPPFADSSPAGNGRRRASPSR